jgi:hypothetical protein
MSDQNGLYKNQPMSKSQPGRASTPSKGDMSGMKNTEHRQFGDEHDFNHKGKVTSNQGSDYHDIGRGNSGLYGNFAEKDKAMEYLKNRGQKGQEVRHYNAGKMEAKMYTGAGPTAYNGNPAYETYKPATSHGAVPDEAIIRPTITRNDNPPLPVQDKETKRLKK